MEATLTQDFIYNQSVHLSQDTTNQSLILWDAGCCFLRYDKEQKIIAAHLRHFKSFDILKIENELLALNVAKVPTTLIVSTQRNIIVPTEMFDESSCTSWLSKLHFVEANEVVKHDNIPHFKAQAIYPISVDLLALLEQYCAEVKTQFLATTLVTKDAATIQYEAQANLYIFEHEFLLLLTLHDKLLLCLVEKYQTTNDLLYFIGSAQQQFNINPQELKIRLSGIEANLENISRELQEFFPSTTLIENNELAYLDFFSKFNTCVS